MTLEILPLGNKCNLNCEYCYEIPMREHSSFDRYDMRTMLDYIDGDFTLFGGEPLLVPIKDIRRFAEYARDNKWKMGIQSNLLSLTDEHIELIKEFNIGVGISIDGPPELNTPRSTEKQTEKILDNVRKLFEHQVIPGLIVTLHSVNLASMDTFLKWFHELGEMGFKSCRIHMLEVDTREGAMIRPSDDQYITFFSRLLMDSFKIEFDLFKEIKQALAHNPAKASCTFNSCNPFDTKSVRGMDGRGVKTNCGRVNKTGPDYHKVNISFNPRYQILQNTPQEVGGCKDCEFFYACTGYCTGSAIDGDWRNRSEHCRVLKFLFNHFRREVKTDAVDYIAPVGCPAEYQGVPHITVE